MKYKAEYGGYLVTAINTNTAIWIDVAEGVRGLGLPCVIEEDPQGEVTVTWNGRKLTVLSIARARRPLI